MTNPPNIDAIIAELSEAQRAAIVAARDAGPFFVVDWTSPWTVPVAEFLTLKSDRLNHLGNLVRSALIGEVGRDG